MNINYEDIIAKASVRAEALKDLQDFAEDAGLHADNLLDALQYFSSLRAKVRALDGEGREMLGAVDTRAQHIGNYAEAVYKTFTEGDSSNSHPRNVLTLVKALK